MFMKKIYLSGLVLGFSITGSVEALNKYKCQGSDTEFKCCLFGENPDQVLYEQSSSIDDSPNDAKTKCRQFFDQNAHDTRVRYFGLWVCTGYAHRDPNVCPMYKEGIWSDWWEGP